MLNTRGTDTACTGHTVPTELYTACTGHTVFEAHLACAYRAVYYAVASKCVCNASCVGAAYFCVWLRAQTEAFLS
jgi:hypothetical protein